MYMFCSKQLRAPAASLSARGKYGNALLLYPLLLRTHPTLLASPTMLSFLHPLTFNNLQSLLQCSTNATKEKNSVFSTSSHTTSCFRERLSQLNGADNEPFWGAQPSHCFPCLYNEPIREEKMPMKRILLQSLNTSSIDIACTLLF